MKTMVTSLLIAMIIACSMMIVGCSSDSQGLLNPNADISQEIPDDPRPVENQPPLIKFECATTSVAPGSSLMVRVNVFDPEDDAVEINYNISSGAVEEQEEGLYRWTLPVQLGIYPLEVTVFDGTNEKISVLFVEVAEQPTFGRIN